MAPQPNYLLGKGESLTEQIASKPHGGPKKSPYTFAEAKRHLTKELATVVQVIDELPEAACPGDEAVAFLTLHPEYLAKSAYPHELFKATGLRTIGSRPVSVTPRRWTKKGEPKPGPTADFYVAGPRETFQKLAHSLDSWTVNTYGADDLIKLEDVRPVRPIDRLKPILSDVREPLLEVVLLAGNKTSARFILDGFKTYLALLGIELDLKKRIDTEALSFMPVKVPRERLQDVARYSFLRVAREMPKLRQLRPNSNGASTKTFAFISPQKDALDSTIRVAVFDGGLPDNSDAAQWANAFDTDGLVEPVDAYQKHGLAVTSALLFGSLDESHAPSVPYAKVDHYRVLDQATENDSQDELYPVLKRILGVLDSRRYDFFNLSIGPNMPIEDDDVHVWTSTLDQRLKNGQTLASVAVGNTGESDAATGLNRIQPPADCVNALAVGSCDSVNNGWKRASYSSIGLGRSPGLMKPDGVACGGTPSAPFWVLDSTNRGFTWGAFGTSFASPLTLRAAIGVRAYLGDALSPLAIRALLIQSAATNIHSVREEVGWGKFPTDIEPLITCGPNAVHVIYQGDLEPRKYLRAPIPVPANIMSGMVEITATICFACETDPQDPMHYTRSGLEIVFRRDRSDIPAGKKTAKTSSFFKSRRSLAEAQLRSDEHKWETVQRVTKRMYGNTLKDPVFDIHYNPRESAKEADNPLPIPYALVVTIRAKQVSDLYNRILNKYRHQLKPLVPKIQIPISV